MRRRAEPVPVFTSQSARQGGKLFAWVKVELE